MRKEQPRAISCVTSVTLKLEHLGGNYSYANLN